MTSEGVAGPILCTAETAELVEVVLRDSAHIQEEDAQHANTGGYSKHRPALPLYDAEDVARTLPLLRPVDFGAATQMGADVRMTLGGLRPVDRPPGRSRTCRVGRPR